MNVHLVEAFIFLQLGVGLQISGQLLRLLQIEQSLMKILHKVQFLGQMHPVAPNDTGIIVHLPFPRHIQGKAKRIFLIGIDEVLQRQSSSDRVRLALQVVQLSFLNESSSVHRSNLKGYFRHTASKGLHQEIQSPISIQNGFCFPLIHWVHLSRIAGHHIHPGVVPTHENNGQGCRSHVHCEIVMILVHDPAGHIQSQQKDCQKDKGFQNNFFHNHGQYFIVIY